MVDRKPKTLQWEVPDSGQVSDSNTERCFTGRLESQFHGYGDCQNGEKILHKYLRTPNGEDCHLSFHKKENNQCNSYSDQRHNCPLLPSVNGRYNRQETSIFKQGHLEIFATETDHSNC